MFTVQGVEYVDGACFMSCVVTNKWSDWSTQAWNSNKLALRIHKIQDDYVVSQKITLCSTITGYKEVQV